MTDAGFPARLEGEDRTIHSVSTLSEAGEGQVSFLSNPKYTGALADTQASAVIVHEDVAAPAGLSTIRCVDPYAGVTVSIVALHGHRKHPQWGISEGAVIDPTAKIGEGANIAPGVTIIAGATLGKNCTLYPGCYVGEGALLGNHCTLFPNVVIYEGCELGDRVTVHANSVIGQDGLGYAPHHDKWIKIPQIGKTVIGDDVEIGAVCAIDRATLGQTEIGPGTKFGNAVVIGHGTKIGADCMFIGQVGVAGSANIGKHVTLAGQSGVAGHLTIGDHVRAGAQAGVLGDIESGADVLGSPAIPIEKARRAMVAVQRLPEWIRRVRDLEREVKALRNKLDQQETS